MNGSTAASKQPEQSKRSKPISWWQILATTAVGIGILYGIGYLGWWAAGRPAYGNWGDLVRSVPLVFAALGAVPAGFIAYRRQRTLERQRNDDRDKHELAESAEARLREAEETRIRELGESVKREEARAFQARYTEVASQLGSEKAAIRLAGVHAAASLIDDWDGSSRRQMCLDLLCGYLCLPLALSPSKSGSDAEAPLMSEDLAETRVRQAIVRVFKGRLKDKGPLHGLVFDLTEAHFPPGQWDLTGGVFVGGELRLTRATFATGAKVSFANAEFKNCTIDLRHATIAAGAVVDLTCARVQTSSKAIFSQLKIEGGQINLGAAIIQTALDFRKLRIASGSVNLGGARFEIGGSASFDDTSLGDGHICLDRSSFVRKSTITLDRVARSGGTITTEGVTGPRGAITADGNPL